MWMPPELDKGRIAALDVIQRHPTHRFAPSQRRALYELFGPNTHPLVKRARGWLAIITARRVLPVWQEAATHDDPEDDPDAELIVDAHTPERLLALAEGVLQGTIEHDVASKAAGDYWYVAGNLIDAAAQYEDTTIGAAYAFNASVIALNEVLRPRLTFTTSEQRADEDETFPDQARDTASCAVLAEAGAEWMAFSDSEKRKAFWEW